MLFSVAACSDSTGAGTGTVDVRLTNQAVAAAAIAADLVGSDVESPLPAGSVKSVDIFVVRVDAKREDATDDDAAQATEDSESEKDGWVTVAEPNKSFDLMTLTDANTLLGDAQVTAGSYKAFRLVIDPAKSSVTLNDATNTVIGGESITGLKFPSADKTGIKIQLSDDLEVKDGETSTLVVKFDVSKSFVMRGSTLDQNGLLFKPVIHGDHD
jgi:hypothetical protein